MEMNLFYWWRKLKEQILQKLVGFKSGQGLYYINGSDTLPPPLTHQEETALMDAIRRGENPSREPLITHNLRLVVYIARKFESPGAGVEDLISIGTIGLIKAVNTFRPEKNIKLATYASRCIENEILMYLRKSSQLRNEVSIDDPLNVDWDGNELLLSDILGSDQDTVNRGVEKEAEEALLLEAVSRLEPREQAIMELRFGLHAQKEHTQKEVADRLFPILHLPAGKAHYPASPPRPGTGRGLAGGVASAGNPRRKKSCPKSHSLEQDFHLFGRFYHHSQALIPPYT